MTEILTNLSDANLAVAIKANLYALFRDLARSPQTEFYEEPGLVRWHTSIPHPWFNGVLSTRPPAGDEAQTIRDTLAYFRSRQAPGFTWWLAPELQIANWSQHLLSQGFRYDQNTPGMATDLSLLPPTTPQPDNLTLQPVEDLELLQLWLRTFITGYQIPETAFTPFFELMAGLGLDLPYRHYLGYLDDKPVATSTLFLGAGVAGIYYVATVPEARGRGAGAALTLLPLHHAREMGYRAGILQSSRMGFPIYRRLGFQELCTMDHFYIKL